MFDFLEKFKLRYSLTNYVVDFDLFFGNLELWKEKKMDVINFFYGTNRVVEPSYIIFFEMLICKIENYSIHSVIFFDFDSNYSTITELF